MKKKIWFVLAVMLIPAFIITSCKKDSEEEETPTNTAPTASFTVTPETAAVNVYFDLDASASSDPETPAAELFARWDFDDDGTWDTDYSSVKTISVAYDTEGTYTIRLEVKDGGGLTATTTKTVTVTNGGNLPPDPPANPNPADGAVDMIILVQTQWTASDPDQDPLKFDVYFGTAADPPLAAEGLTNNSYDPGTLAYNTTYYWKVRVHDDKGLFTDGPVWSFTTGSEVFGCGDDFTDDRDGKTYSTVQIGEQCWMAENINIGIRINGSEDMTDDGSIEKYCYDDNESNCDEFGALYQWNEMLQYASDEAVGICPEGWHLPAIEEWEALEMELGMPEDQATATSGWQGTYEGNQLKIGGSSGFDALMGGNRSTSGGFILGGLGTALWSATQSTTYNARARSLDTDHGAINHTNYNKEYGHAVRCLLD